MGRPPSIVVIEPGICARLDRDETVRSVFIGHGSTGTTEVGIERSGMLVVNVLIPSGGVRLPNLDKCVGHGAPVTVEHTPAYDDALTNWLAGVLAGQIVVFLAYPVVPKNRSGNL